MGDNKEKERILNVQNEEEKWFIKDEVQFYHRLSPQLTYR